MKIILAEEEDYCKQTRTRVNRKRKKEVYWKNELVFRGKWIMNEYRVWNNKLKSLSKSIFKSIYKKNRFKCCLDWKSFCSKERDMI